MCLYVRHKKEAKRKFVTLFQIRKQKRVLVLKTFIHLKYLLIKIIDQFYFCWKKKNLNTEMLLRTKLKIKFNTNIRTFLPEGKMMQRYVKKQKRKTSKICFYIMQRLMQKIHKDTIKSSVIAFLLILKKLFVAALCERVFKNE